MYTYFDVEQQLIECWGVSKDLSTLKAAMDKRVLSEDNISNVLLGITELLSLKFESLHEMIKECEGSDYFVEKVKVAEIIVTEINDLFKTYLDDGMPYDDVKKELDSLVFKNENRFNVAWDVYSELVHTRKFKN